MSQTPRFWLVIKNASKLASLFAAAAVAAPLLDLIAKVGPPEPNGVPYFSSAAALLCILYTAQFWPHMSSAAVGRQMKHLALLTVGASALYLALFLILVAPAPGGRVATGFLVKPSVAALLGPVYSTRDALRDAAYDPAEVWVEWTVRVIEMVLLAVWLALVSFFSLFVGGFLVRQYASVNPTPKRRVDQRATKELS